MTAEEYQWHIKLVQDRYHALNLTFEQAEQIYKFEQEKNTYSDKHYFSAWEEWDYELTSFKEILNVEQFESYEVNLKEGIARYEASLVEQDKENSKDIAYQEELLGFYRDKFLPEIYKDPFLLTIELLHDKPKVDYLKAEYRKFLNDTKKEILTNHFRHNRAFKPNVLQASLLRHQLIYLWPDYFYFKQKMDEPTKTVATYLSSKLSHYSVKTSILTKLFEELTDFNEAVFKKYYSEEKGGWHVVIGQRTPEEEQEEKIMSLLLLDNDKYGVE